MDITEIKMIDVYKPAHVEVEVQDRGERGIALYIHVNGLTLLRVEGIMADQLDLKTDLPKLTHRVTD